MKTGVIVYGTDSDNPSECATIEGIVSFLDARGHKNVRAGFYHGDPGADKVMYEMFEDGVDTFAILPMVLAEGRMSIWLMPEKIHLPDNCGSWTIIDGKDVATRFATALGFDVGIASDILKSIGSPERGKGVILIARGSPLSICEKTVKSYVKFLQEAGWTAECAFMKHGRTIHEVIEDISSKGINDVCVVPMFIGPSEKTLDAITGSISDKGMKINICPKISEFDSFLAALESKIPNGW